MIRTKTTFIIGAGASCELQMPSGPELVTRIAQSLDFARYGAELQTRDSTLLMQYLAKASARAGKGEDVLNAAALRIRTAAKMGGSIDAILEQHNNDPMILRMVIGLIIGVVPGAQIGAWLSHKLKGKTIVIALAVCLGLVGLRILFGK